ncbi:apoptosis-enhancing nuclease [Polymixia lowei]
MAEASNRNKASLRSSWGLLNNYSYLCRRTMMLHAVENTKARKKHQQENSTASLKRKRTENLSETTDTCKIIKKTKLYSGHIGQEIQSTLNLKDTSAKGSISGQLLCGSQTSTSRQPKVADHQRLATALGESWEVDSGFSSETSPPASGRSSPSLCPWQATMVALDCEMVGTGPGGRCSELARCSILDYHGNVLYDKYIRPCQPVTDYRTRWSGIQKHHLQNAMPFAEAREEILGILDGKVVVGHSVCNDFKALDMFHPCHMVRDISSMRLLRQLAGFPHRRCLSLKILASKLLDRRIQVGRRGHCSVEDALAALDLYKLVEAEWEQELQDKLKYSDALLSPVSADHYMQDQYWPDHLIDDSQ